MSCSLAAVGLNAGPERAGNSVSFDVSPVEEGWVPYAVTTVAQTRDGYLWLGTYNGLVRFDGVRSRLFVTANTPGLPNNRITSLYEDNEETLWIGHETGDLSRFAAGHFQTVTLGQHWPGGSVEAISADENKDLWLLNNSGWLFRVRDGQSRQSPGGGSAARKTWISPAGTGKLFIAANGNIAALEQGRLVPFRFGQTAPGEFYQAVFPAHDGGLWVMGNGRLRKWRDDRWVADLGNCPCDQGYVTALLETRSGAVLAGTLKDGLYRLSPDAEPLHFSRTNGLSHDWVRSLCEDHEGNVWIGTGSGLDTLRARKVRMLNAPDRWQGRAVLSFALEPSGAAWIGSEGAGLYHYEHGEWSSFTESSGLANLFVWSVLETRRGQLFVGTWGGGLMVKTGERFESPGDLAKVTEPVVSLFEGKDGALWVGTIAGLQRFESGKLAWSAGKERLALPDVRAIAESADGTIWFGMSGGGLGSLKGGALRQFRKQDGLASDFVQCLYADGDGTLWIGTSDSGLCRWKRGKFATIRAEQGLPATIICHLVDDGEGNLWISSHLGIVRANKAELDRCADDPARPLHCLSYGKAEGLASPICSGGFQPGACKSADGRLWVPTARGLAIIDPGSVTTNTVPPPVVIEELLVDRQPLGIANQGQPLASKLGRSNGTGQAPASRQKNLRALQIPPGKQRFEIHYTALSFPAPEKVRFRYKLAGLESDWVEAGTIRVAEYSYLPPGDYSFQVIACNNDEIWNREGATLAFTVLPYVWQTWWFQALAILAGAWIVGAFVLAATRRRVRRKLEQVERQRALERERSRIARDIHDDLGASLTRITMLSQTVRSELESAPQAAADVDQIYTTARELTKAMDEIVWAVNPRHDTLDSLVTYLGRFAQEFLSAAGIRCRLEVPMHLPAWALTAEIRHNVFLAFKEALHNIVKHAAASEVQIFMELFAARFVLVIVDNGRGFELDGQNEIDPRSPVCLPAPQGERGSSTRLAPGNGLLNMRKRLDEVGGRCEWDTAPEKGTRVKLTVLVKQHGSLL